MNIKEIYNLYTKDFLVDTDTRAIRKNTIFFALKGANFNGNKFAEEALKKGARYAIIDEKKYNSSQRTILVEDVLKTLQQLANYHRSQLAIPIIGLTGSNGKTTTKELINCVLSKKYNTTATKGNLNNAIGVPLTLLSMTPKTEIGIVEMGANHQKEIAFLATICEPDYGYITNFGKAHLEGFGGVKGVIKGKSELYDFLIEHKKTAFVNPEDSIQVEKTKHCKTIYFLNDVSLVKASPLVTVKLSTQFINSNLIGKYNYTNIAAAITIGNYFKVNNKQIQEALEAYIPRNNRSQIIEKKNNKIILDAYNANPSSMQVAIDHFSNLKESPKTVILGDMFELGVKSKKEHQAIVKLADSKLFENTFYVGENFDKSTTKNHQFKSFEELQNYLQKKPLINQIILIKGSRGMKLERVLEFID